MKKFYLLFVTLFVCACSVYEDPPPIVNNEKESEDTQARRTRSSVSAPNASEILDDSEMILGEELDNPYRVSVVQAAYNRLSASVRAKAPGFSPRTTHRYYKFPCVDSTRLDLTTQFAADHNIELYDYPFLEREVLREGIYRDPTRTGDAPNPMYGVLPAYLAPPITLQPILLQSLCILDADLYDDAPITRAETLPDDFVIALVNQSMSLTGNTQDMIAPGTRGGSDKWTPSGKIQVWDDKVDGLVPLVGAKVRCRRWATIHVGITDANGNFTCDGAFKREGNYNIIWESKYWDIRNNGVQALYNGPKQKGAWNLNIYGGKSVYNATIHRAAYRWWHDNIGGLSRPNYPNKLKIKYEHDSGRSFYQRNGHGGAIRDIVIFGKKSGVNRTTDDVFSTSAHEIGHAVHSAKFTYSNWGDLDSFWKESWAVFAQLLITTIEYASFEIYIEQLNPDYRIIIGQMRVGLKMQWITRATEYPNYLNRNSWNVNLNADDARYYSPIYIDLVDLCNQRYYYTTRGDNNPAIYPDDDIRGVPIENVENIALRCRNLVEFKNELSKMIGKSYENKYISQDVIDRYISVYETFL